MNNQPSISRAFSTFTSSPTAIIRSAFGLEAALFTIVSGTLLLDTDTLLTTGFARNAAFVTPLSLYIARMWGSTGLALCVPLAWGASSKATPRERRLVYWTMLAADTAAVLTAIAMWAGGADTGLQSGLNLQMAAGQLVPLCWRLWCLLARPQWFGQEKNSEKGFESDEKV
jgi:hypothetical protein